MKAISLFVVVFACSLGATMSHTAQAKSKWVCMKDGEEIKVKGKKPKEKEKDCTAQEGVWEKKQGSADKQSSGSGGGW